MTEDRSIHSLEANKLMRSPLEVAAFENALFQLSENPQNKDLPALHLIFDDRCQQPEVMFSLVHFLESLFFRDACVILAAQFPRKLDWPFL